MANICYQNRNVFAHATPHSAAENDKLRISKGTGKDNIGAQHLFSLDDLKEMADSTHETVMFGLNVSSCIQTRQAIKSFLDRGMTPPRVLIASPLPKNLLCHEVGIKSAKFPYRLSPRRHHRRANLNLNFGRASIR